MDFLTKKKRVKTLRSTVIKLSAFPINNINSKISLLRKNLGLNSKMKFSIPQKNRKWNANLKNSGRQVHMLLLKVVSLLKTCHINGFWNMRMLLRLRRECKLMNSEKAWMLGIWMQSLDFLENLRKRKSINSIKKYLRKNQWALCLTDIQI